MFIEDAGWIKNPQKTKVRRMRRTRAVRARKPRRRIMARVKARRRSRKGRMPAGLARYWAGRRSARRSNPPRRRRRRAVVHRNAPRRHRRRSYASNPPRRRHSRRSYRRNPGIPSSGFLMDAAYVTGGFFATRIATGYVLPLIGMGETPLIRLGAKGVVAWGLGFLGGKFLGPKAGQLLLLGGLVEVMSDAVRTYVSPFVPALAGDGMGSYPMLSSYPQLSGNGYDTPYSVSGSGVSDFDEAT